MEPEDYDAWYGTSRGAWIGEQEYRLLRTMLAPREGEMLLDVGCGTGYFTRRFAAGKELRVAGLDTNFVWLRYAASRLSAGTNMVCGSSETLPFRDAAFDLTVSVAALCFLEDERKGIREILRVTRRRFAIGLLHRRSMLYLQKGQRGGSGAYHGARWHTESDIRELFSGVPVANLEFRTAVALPGGGMAARSLEPFLCPWWPFASFVAVAGDVVARSLHRA